MLVKLTTCVNFINNLWGAFQYQGVFGNFSILTVWFYNLMATEHWCKRFLYESVLYNFMHYQFVFVIFCQREIFAKAARKMLVKFTNGVNFNNILRASFWKSVSHSFMGLQFGFVIFWQEEICKKKLLIEYW